MYHYFINLLLALVVISSLGGMEGSSHTCLTAQAVFFDKGLPTERQLSPQAYSIRGVAAIGTLLGGVALGKTVYDTVSGQGWHDVVGEVLKSKIGLGAVLTTVVCSGAAVLAHKKCNSVRKNFSTLVNRLTLVENLHIANKDESASTSSRKDKDQELEENDGQEKESRNVIFNFFSLHIPWQEFINFTKKGMSCYKDQSNICGISFLTKEDERVELIKKYFLDLGVETIIIKSASEIKILEQNWSFFYDKSKPTGYLAIQLPPNMPNNSTMAANIGELKRVAAHKGIQCITYGFHDKDQSDPNLGGYYRISSMVEPKEYKVTFDCKEYIENKTAGCDNFKFEECKPNISNVYTSFLIKIAQQFQLSSTQCDELLNQCDESLKKTREKLKEPVYNFSLLKSITVKFLIDKKLTPQVNWGEETPTVKDRVREIGDNYLADVLEEICG